MEAISPYYYGLVKQIGPWKTTRQDILRAQKPYEYTPNNQIDTPYTMPSGNGSVYAQYSSQGLIYNASTTPVVASFGKLRRGRIVKSKKVAIIGSDGKLVGSPIDSYGMVKFMDYARAQVQNQTQNSTISVPLNSFRFEGFNNAEASRPYHAPQSSLGSVVGQLGNIGLGSDLNMAEESIVSRYDAKMGSPVGAVDYPYGYFE